MTACVPQTCVPSGEAGWTLLPDSHHGQSLRSQSGSNRTSRPAFSSGSAKPSWSMATACPARAKSRHISTELKLYLGCTSTVICRLPLCMGQRGPKTLQYDAGELIQVLGFPGYEMTLQQLGRSVKKGLNGHQFSSNQRRKNRRSNKKSNVVRIRTHIH